MKKILVAAIMMVFTTQAWAGIYLEPYLGYEIGTAKGTVMTAAPTTITVNDKLSGPNFGAKVGFSMLVFAVGVDYMAGTIAGEDQGTPPVDNDWKATDIGLFAQFSLPMLMKFSATYFLSSKFDSDTANASGSGIKVGVGFTMFPLISINLDMININYDDATISGQTVTSADVDRKSFMVGVSLPLDF